MNVIIPFYLRDDIDMGAEKVVKLATDIWGKISYSRDDITIIIVALNPPKVWNQQKSINKKVSIYV